MSNEQPPLEALLEAFTKALRNHTILPRDLAEKALACYYGSGPRAWEREGFSIPTPPFPRVARPQEIVTLSPTPATPPTITPTPQTPLPYRIEPWARKLRPPTDAGEKTE